MQLKTIRFSSHFHNDGKFDRLKQIDKDVLVLKNQMSNYILKNFDKLLFDKNNLLKDYKLFRIPDLSAWETQSLFQDIIILYENQLQKRKQNVDFRIQTSLDVLREKLHTQNEDGIWSPKRQKKETIKQIIFDFYGYV